MTAYDYGSGGFPESPITGDTLVMSGVTYEYDGSAWVVQVGGAASLDNLSDVNVTLPADAEVLTYNGTSGEWENQAAGGGGAWEVISHVNASDVASVSFSLSGYDRYAIMFHDVRCITITSSYLTASLKNASVNIAYFYQWKQEGSSTSGTNGSSENQVLIAKNIETDNYKGTFGTAYITATSAGTTFQSESASYYNGGAVRHVSSYSSNSAITADEILLSATQDNMSGIFTLYGIKNS